MKQLTLDPELLYVESFPTAPLASASAEPISSDDPQPERTLYCTAITCDSNHTCETC